MKYRLMEKDLRGRFLDKGVFEQTLPVIRAIEDTLMEQGGCWQCHFLGDLEIELHGKTILLLGWRPWSNPTVAFPGTEVVGGRHIHPEVLPTDDEVFGFLEMSWGETFTGNVRKLRELLRR